MIFGEITGYRPDQISVGKPARIYVSMQASVDQWAFCGWRTKLEAVADGRKTQEEQVFWTTDPSRDSEVLDFGIMPDRVLSGTITLKGLEPSPMPVINPWITLDTKRFTIYPVRAAELPQLPYIPTPIVQPPYTPPPTIKPPPDDKEWWPLPDGEWILPVALLGLLAIVALAPRKSKK